MRNVDTVWVPRVYWSHTSSRVLTMEFAEGVFLADVLRATSRGDEEFLEGIRQRGFDGDEVGRNLHINFLTSAFIYSLFHADQHPGNLLIQDGNRIAYIDFGIVGKWDRATQAVGLRFVKALADADIDEAFDIFVNDIAVPSPRTRLEELGREVKGAMRDWLFHVDFPHATLEEQSMARLLVKILDSARRHQVELPLETLAYYRTMITLDSIYLQIAPNYDVRRGGRDFYVAAIANRILDRVSTPDGLRRMLLQYLDMVSQFPEERRRDRRDRARQRAELTGRVAEVRDRIRSLRRATVLGLLLIATLMVTDFKIRDLLAVQALPVLVLLLLLVLLLIIAA
jgi:ubiquinone biosynthesis protein